MFVRVFFVSSCVRCLLQSSGKFCLSPGTTGAWSFFIAAVMVGYAIAASVALLNPATACLSAFGGGGC
jgi:hypothetical protein